MRKTLPTRCFPVKELIGTVFAGSSASTHTLQLLLYYLWSCPLCPTVTGVTRQLRDGTETPRSGAQRKSFSLWPQIQHPLSLPRLGDKQRAAMSKEQRSWCPAHIHAQWYTAARGSPGSSQPHRPSSIHSQRSVPWHQVSRLAGAELKTKHWA